MYSPRKRFILTLTIGALLSSLALRGQDTKETPPKPKAATTYRIDFSLSELEDGKKVNARQYAMNLTSGSPAGLQHNLKIGTRVPVEMKQGEMQYVDVGVNIWAHLSELGNGLALDARLEMSNFADPNQQARGPMPLLRQLEISGSTDVEPGKTVVLGVVDDPNSKRQFQLDVLVSRLR